MRTISMRQIASLLGTHENLFNSPIQGFSVDSRTIQHNEVFVALKGARVDGHQCLKEVSHRNAMGAIVSNNYQGDDFGLNLIRVDDPLVALQKLAKHTIQSSKSKIVAITGSLGKTTTKDFTKTLLSTRYRVGASPGNSNSQVGLPLSILNHTTGEEDILVLEMGMTHPGQILKLIDIAPPTVAVLTKVALVHACNFDTIEEIARSKSEILSHAKTELGIIAKEIPLFEDIVLVGPSKKISFSVEDSLADYFIDPKHPQSMQHFGKKAQFLLPSLNVAGKHNLHNLLASALVARYFDISWEQIIQQIPLLQLPERRLQSMTVKDVHFINDSYNASELSVKAALESIHQTEGNGRKIAVIGSMKELGKFSEECHHQVGEKALNCVEKIYCLGEECYPIYDLWRSLNKPVKLFLTRAELVQCLQDELRSKDVVLLKGARSHELWKVLEEF